MITNECIRVLDYMASLELLEAGKWFSAIDLKTDSNIMAVLLEAGYVRKFFSAPIYTRTDLNV